MDSTVDQNEPKGYTTSKQVQAWFLKRSRDNWKKKYVELRVEIKRLRQHVVDACKSRDGWRSQVQAMSRQIEELRDQIALLQGRLDALVDEDKKND